MIFSLLLSILIGLTADISLKEKIINDISLIIPGIGAERAVLAEDADAVISIKGYPESVSEFKDGRELFENVFGIESSVKIYFNKIYYYDKQKAVIFINNNRISGIAGLKNSRITIDSVDLSKGIEYIIFGYGNSKLSILVKSDDKKGDKLYLYPNTGIAFIDDGDDDKIDMYLVFPKINKI